MNAIWIFGDQHRAQALSVNGDPNLVTPNLDRLAGEGQNYSQAISGCPLCCPYRGSLLTSRYPHECVPGHEHRMPENLKTIAHAFKDNNYETSYFGKWHVDGFKERNGRGAMHIIPPERRGGFDNWIGYENNNSQWDCWVHGGKDDESFHHRLPGYETDCLTDLLIDFIERKGNEKKDDRMKPFFTALSVQPPHDPYLAPAEWMERHQPQDIILRPNVPKVPRIEKQVRKDLAGYYAMIENLDWNVGRVRDALIQAQLDKDTHIIFFSDHGDMHGSHGQFRKTSPYEESIRTPLILGGLTANYEGKQGTQNALINHVDMAPTTLGLCGLDKPDWMRGNDLSGLRLANRPQVTAPDSAFLQSVIPTGHGDSIDRPWRAVVTNDGWKYAAIEGQPWLLFNLNEDPYEQCNLAFNTKFKNERSRLQDRLAQWIAETGDEFNLPDL